MTSKNKVPLESWEQEKIFNWRNENMSKYPALAMYFATGNGLTLTKGQAEKAKAQGILERGIPDIIGDMPLNGFHGHRIELKRVKNSTISPEQKARLYMLNALGYKAEVCYGANEAIETIKKYLGIKE